MTDLEKRIDHFYASAAICNVSIQGEFFKYLNDVGFFTAPASTKYHGAYEGGLYDHSSQVYHELKKLTEKNELKWIRQQSPFIIGMFHDLCKCDQYVKREGARTDLPGGDILQFNAGYHYEYNTNTLLKGHGTKSIMLLSQFMVLTEEEMLCIRYHMGAYGREQGEWNEKLQKIEWAEFDMAIRKYPNVLWTHHADQIASKIDNI